MSAIKVTHRVLDPEESRRAWHDHVCPLCSKDALRGHCVDKDTGVRTCTWERCEFCQAVTDGRRAYRAEEARVDGTTTDR